MYIYIYILFNSILNCDFYDGIVSSLVNINMEMKGVL